MSSTLAQMWLRRFGLPHEFVTDADGAFQGEFAERLCMLGAAHRVIPADAHYQLGTIESNNHHWRGMLHRVIDARAIHTTTDIDDAILAVDHAVNSLARRCGRSPYQATCGRVPRWPGELLSDNSNALTWENISQNQALAMGEQYRLDAIGALADQQAESRLKEAILRKTSSRKEGFTPGQKVGYWREQGPPRGAGKRSRRAGYMIGTFVNYDPGSDGRGLQNNAWVMHGNRCVLVAREQLRHAQGFEHWSPSAEDLEQLRRAEDKIRQGDVRDERQDGPREEEDHFEDQDISVLPEPLPLLEGLPDPGPIVLQPLPQPSSSSSSSAPPLPPPDLPTPVSAPQALRPRPPLLEDQLEEQNPGSTPASSAPTGQPEVKRPRLASALQVCGDTLVIDPDDEGWDGRLLPPAPFCNLSNMALLPPVQHADDWVDQETYQAAAAGESDEEQNFTTPASLSRKERKQLDKEIPWREIIRRGPAIVDRFVQAAIKEAAAFRRWGSLRPCSRAEAQRIFNDPSLRKRCLRSRAFYKDKNGKWNQADALPQDISAKCRIVVHEAGRVCAYGYACWLRLCYTSRLQRTEMQARPVVGRRRRRDQRLLARILQGPPAAHLYADTKGPHLDESRCASGGRALRDRRQRVRLGQCPQPLQRFRARKDGRARLHGPHS